jgi:hypothetical protein
LLSFTSECFVFLNPVNINIAIPNGDFACCFVWVGKLAFHIKGRTWIEHVLELVFLIIFWSKREELTEDWRKLHNEEIHNCSLHQLLSG